MNSVLKAPISTAAKFMLVLFVLVGAIRIADFIFYGKELRNVFSGVGFSLMAYGLYKNGFTSPAQDRNGRLASYVGATLVLGAIAARYLA
ncbi:hypothetical protein [Cognatiluteimonas telluris]|jgi:hypothetical protein|uniref:hypothetical protein n=1 Tax=Cognatiluteimonas telluris TaxID=1104775 RepID=UPI001407D66D|nr:hypothetical protein [Lysobacter telluris]